MVDAVSVSAAEVVQVIDEGAYSVGDSIGIITAETWSGEIIGGEDSICITQD